MIKTGGKKDREKINKYLVSFSRYNYWRTVKRYLYVAWVSIDIYIIVYTLSRNLNSGNFTCIFAYHLAKNLSISSTISSGFTVRSISWLYKMCWQQGPIFCIGTITKSSDKTYLILVTISIQHIGIYFK